MGEAFRADLASVSRMPPVATTGWPQGWLGSGDQPLTPFCRELYAQFLREMIIQPGVAKANLGVSREDVTFEDHVSWGLVVGHGI